jgi:hypothetical protein
VATIPTSKQIAETIKVLGVNASTSLDYDPAGVMHYWALVTAYYTAKMYEESRPAKWVGGPR